MINGGFEAGNIGGWTFTNGSGFGVQKNTGAAEGTNHVAFTGTLLQDLPTVPSRDYALTFAYPKSYAPPIVMWGGEVVSNLTNFANSGLVWNYAYAYVHTEASVTRLSFTSSGQFVGSMDDVRVGWLQEPIVIASQPQSITAYEGGSASFLVGAQGSPLLNYQWIFNGQPCAQGKAGGFMHVPGIVSSERFNHGQLLELLYELG